MMCANRLASGTFTPQGEDASTRKNSAPLSFTIRSTSDKGSLAADPTADDTASDADARSWSLPMARGYIGPPWIATRRPIMSAKSPAEIYQELFVPALFQQWGGVVAAAVALRAGERVLDVACGTGVAALAAAECVGREGQVVGLDPNVEMLAVARRTNQAVDWREGCAESLPFPDASFDAVVSQFGFMFFKDRVAALREMLRVLRRRGRLAVAVCDALERSPGYAALAALLERLFGQGVANAFRAPFMLGDREQLVSLCAQAGVAGAAVRRHEGTVRFASIQSPVATERDSVWTLGGMLGDAQF